MGIGNAVVVSENFYLIMLEVRGSEQQKVEARICYQKERNDRGSREEEISPSSHYYNSIS